MFRRLPIWWAAIFCLNSLSSAQEIHAHEAPEQLGTVSFSVSCKASVQSDFNRAVALLHSFAYSSSEQAFRAVIKQDPACAMAHWGVAMSYFHQIWQPAIAAPSYRDAAKEIELAQRIGGGTERERMFIRAASLVFADPKIAYENRALAYEQAMAELARANRGDTESQVFYALALVANASPSDKTHARQKKAADILEPLFQSFPQHPGIAHYLIHACDNAEMAPRGLSAARLYAKIAPSAPHALHMPSHIFTRLGLWDDSIASNIAAREAAHRAGDIGEELHSMDYLVYAYLQLGRDAEAAQIVDQLKGMPASDTGDFKVSYASVAMPVRYVVERRQWDDAASFAASTHAPPEVAAVAVWARGEGSARGEANPDAGKSAERLRELEQQLQNSGKKYWAEQVGILRKEVLAWEAFAGHNEASAEALLREAADLEDAVEKLPVTPGPIVPAREQLGELFLQAGKNQQAMEAFRTALALAPGRRGAIQGLAEASERAREK